MNIKGLYGNEKESWRDAAKYISSQYHEGDIIIFHPFFARHPFEYYLSKYPNKKNEPYAMPELAENSYRSGGGTKQPGPNSKFITTSNTERIWFVMRNDQTPNREEQQKDIRQMLNAQYIVIDEKYYKMITIEEYTRKD